MTTSIFTSISSFISRRYNLNTTLSDRDRESLARDIAYSLKHIPTSSSSQTQEQQQQLHDSTASVEDGNDDELETALQELEQTLDQCELSLDEFEKKERFLFVRIERYRKMIRERECFIIETQDKGQRHQEKKKTATKNDDSNEESIEESQHTDDVENNDNNTTKDKISQLIHKLQQDQTNLQDVETIHADIIAQIETLKRRIIELEDKKHDILKKREECREFLVEVAEKL